MSTENIKSMILFDKGENVKDSMSLHKTKIMIRDLDTQELLFEGSNKVILAGSTFTAMKHFAVTPIVMTPTYNAKLALENTVAGEAHLESIEKVCLFAIGTDGCGAGPAQLNDVDYSKWLAPADMVPFRYPLATADLDASARAVYFGRKVNGSRVNYYFKKFEGDPVFKQQYVDGTAIDVNVYDSTKIDAIETYIELKLKILKEDAREYFINAAGAGGIESARVNTIMLLTGWPKAYAPYNYYEDIRPLTKLNFPTEYLIDETKGLDITYHLYY